MCVSPMGLGCSLEQPYKYWTAVGRQPWEMKVVKHELGSELVGFRSVQLMHFVVLSYSRAAFADC